MREGKMYRVNHQKKGDLKKHGHNYSEIHQKGKNWCVLENSAQMLQDWHQTVQNWWKNGLEKKSLSWQTPSKNRSKLTALDFFHF